MACQGIGSGEFRFPAWPPSKKRPRQFRGNVPENMRVRAFVRPILPREYPSQSVPLRRQIVAAKLDQRRHRVMARPGWYAHCAVVECRVAVEGTARQRRAGAGP